MRTNSMKNIAYLLLFAVFIFASCETKPKEEAVVDEVMTTEEGVTITTSEMATASKIYFQTCAGCHGTLRKGATGPSLLPEARTKLLTTEGLKAFIHNGTPGGMPDWGNQGLLTESQIDLLARFLQFDPPPIPPFTLADMKSFWKVIVPVEIGRAHV